MRLVAIGLVAAAVLVTAACTGDPPAPFCPGGQCVSQETRWYFGPPPPSEIDVVMVIDDSPSMQARQVAVLERLERAIEETVTRQSWQLDLEMRVISTTAPGAAAGAPGCGVRRAAACAAPDPGVFRWNQICGAGPNFEGPPGPAMACAARFVGDGCAIEQPLAALEDELRRAPLRPRAFLFLLIVTDDDCSFTTPPFPLDQAVAAGDTPQLSRRCHEADAEGRLEPLSRYADLLRSLKPAHRVLVSLVGGPCTGDGLDVPTPSRLQRFAASWEDSATLTAVCASDWRPAFRSLGERLATLLRVDCLHQPLSDRDPTQPGVQPECAVSEWNAAGVARALPSCRSGTLPCWRVTDDATCTSGVRFQIDRGGCVPPAGTTINVACATTPL